MRKLALECILLDSSWAAPPRVCEMIALNSFQSYLMFFWLPSSSFRQRRPGVPQALRSSGVCSQSAACRSSDRASGTAQHINKDSVM